MKEKDELTYWEKRAILAEEKVKLSADKTSNMIIRAYLHTQNYFREEIRKLFRRAERLTGASEDVMKNVLSQKVPYEELMEFSRLAKSENKEVAKVARERLQQEAIKFRITRLDVLRAKAYIATKQLADVEKLKTEDLLTRTAKKGIRGKYGRIRGGAADHSTVDWRRIHTEKYSQQGSEKHS